MASSPSDRAPAAKDRVSQRRGPLPQHLIDEVLKRTDLVAVVSRHVELKRAGREFKGRCPFHHEKVPSFYVVPEKRFYFCHGCRASGDAISFLARVEGKSFIQAVQALAEAANVALPATSPAAEQERQALLRANRAAAAFFEEQLWAPGGAGAREFLAKRGLHEKILRRFGIGLAPASWNALAEVVREIGLNEEALRLGLIQLRRDGKAHIDFFRNRLMVPLRDVEGNLRGFCGRLLGGEGPPLLYSKNSPLFRKSELVFGGDAALPEWRKSRRALLVQAFTDCMLLHQAGFTNAAAVLVAPPPIEMLRHLKSLGVREVSLVLPREEEFAETLLHWGRVFLEGELAASVAWLPTGDTLRDRMKREGAEGLKAFVDSACPLSVSMFTEVLPRAEASTMEEKLQALALLRPVLTELPPGLNRTTVLSGMAKHFGLPLQDIETELRPNSRQRSGARSARSTRKTS